MKPHVTIKIEKLIICTDIKQQDCNDKNPQEKILNNTTRLVDNDIDKKSSITSKRFDNRRIVDW